ncbi:Head-to-tail connector protein, podovirus-type [uncultured Caudovirales phage]|uniref:Head-to-tail connector protein, podovirus-type n=1 Tax=uncultured Caudovirales phage TaxID=2100421 RepID=A0A6J5KQJ6_9CAUD|nr:Head-to-tail connector protein, podovirus-type [uncultured Caudovirales phage]
MSDGGMTAKSRYDRLESDRLTFLDRARRCAEITIPTLIPPQAHSKSTIYYTPWQGIGARGVNNLASKLLLSLLPPNSPFFRLDVDDFTIKAMTGDPTQRAIVEEGLNKIERAVQSEIEGTGLRSPTFLALKNLIVGGNYLTYLPKEGGMKGYRLDSYVVKRDVLGDVLEIIAKDEVSPASLPKDVRMMLDDDHDDDYAKGHKDAGEAENETEYDDALEDYTNSCQLFTHMYRAGDKWRLYQEIKGKRIPGSEGTYPLDKCPMIVMRWSVVDNEDYGRSYVEEYLGDLVSLEGLSKAIVQAAAAAAKTVFLLNPNGVTRLNDVVKAESGDVIIGVKTDIDSVQTDKQADMRIAYEASKTITDRLSMAFMLNTSVQRQAERVTAEEIKFVATELEDALGGVYTILSQEFQLPLVRRLMDRMTKAKRLPALPTGIVKPVIVTGVEALGRGQDLGKLNALVQALAPLGPDVLKQYLNPGDYIKRVATSLSLDFQGLVKSDEQIQQEMQQEQQAQQQQQMMQMAGSAIPNATKAIGDQALAAQQSQSAPPGPPGS